MKLLFLIVAIVIFILIALLVLTGGTWATIQHLFALLGIGLAFLAASFLPIP